MVRVNMNVYRLRFCVEFADKKEVLFVEYYAVNTDMVTALESTREFLATSFPTAMIYPEESGCAMIEKTVGILAA